MKKHSDLDHLFKELDTIPRTQQSKQRSYQLIKENLEVKEKKRSSLMLSFITITLFVGFMVGSLALIENTNNSSTSQDSPFSDLVKENKINRTFLAKSKSEKTFNINNQTGLMMGTIVIDNDDQWNKELMLLLEQLEEIDAVPFAEPNYDMLIKWSDNTNLKFKLYFSDGVFFLKDVSENKYYKSTAENSETLQAVLRRIPTIN
ncbi:hypothetical protein IMZ08_18760 [Bacillus luteolus]|uniref:Uncharacterized protein n=1 Tax=Litchfieldia luteola TaxID=682179 RepID=A0ABR9QNT9_9BACI|nr:hypothetical protein [Cytobacillus luteolus]MBE4910081.1 hypothetical protein [Cytobacillus luteolus]MBP1942355.1 hypothetical protein [Cytobacillus luteolus]